jgi:hypothetical protein
MDTHELIKRQLSIAHAALEAAFLMLEPEENPPDECQHQNKIDMSTMGGGVHWICRDCGYQYVEGGENS